MTPAEAVAKLDAIDSDDPDASHGEADYILWQVAKQVAPDVAAAYERVVDRQPWWATA